MEREVDNTGSGRDDVSGSMLGEISALLSHRRRDKLIFNGTVRVKPGRGGEGERAFKLSDPPVECTDYDPESRGLR